MGCGGSVHQTAQPASDITTDSHDGLTGRSTISASHVKITKVHRHDDDNDTLSSISDNDEYTPQGHISVMASAPPPTTKPDEEVLLSYDGQSYDLPQMERTEQAIRRMKLNARKAPGSSSAPLPSSSTPGAAAGSAAAGAKVPSRKDAFRFNDFVVDEALRQMDEPVVLPATAEPSSPGPQLPLAPGARDIMSFDLRSLLGHAARVKCLSIASGEKEYVSSSNEDSHVYYYDMKSGKELGIFSGHQDTVIFATFSACGKFLATTSRDNTLILWDVVTQKALLTFEHAKVVICCCFSRDSKFIATGCQDKVCRLWETRRGREAVTFAQHDGIIIAMAFSPDGSHVCSASADKTLRVWTAAKGRQKHVLSGHSAIILSCHYTADGRRVVSNDERVLKVWSVEDGLCIFSLSVDDATMKAGAPSLPGKKLTWTLSCPAPGKLTSYVVVACNNRFVFVYNFETGLEALSVICRAPVYCLAPGYNTHVGLGDANGNIYMLVLRLREVARTEDEYKKLRKTLTRPTMLLS